MSYHYRNICAIFIVIIATIYVSSFQYFPSQRWYIIADHQLSKISRFINNNESVFSFKPQYCIAIGANYRIVPNDKMERIAEYAKNTKVRWLLLNKHDRISFFRLEYYDKTNWLSESSDISKLEEKFPGILKLRAATRTGYFIYEFI